MQPVALRDPGSRSFLIFICLIFLCYEHCMKISSLLRYRKVRTISSLYPLGKSIVHAFELPAVYPKKQMNADFYRRFTNMSSSNKRNFNKFMSMSSSPPLSHEQQQQQHKPNRHLVLIIAGPTAVGKSAVAAKLCSKEIATQILSDHAENNHHVSGDKKNDKSSCSISRGHIISADSVQAYQGVEIGANKPTLEEREETPHHLIDIVDSRSICQYNAADWMRDAMLVLERLKSKSGGVSDDDSVASNSDIDTKQRREIIEQFFEESSVDNEEILPVIVGGTMMYLQWLVHGRPDAMKPSQEAIEKASSVITEYEKENDWKGATEHVSSLGPLFEERVLKLPGKDWYRLRRTLEVAYTVLHDEDKEEKIKQLYNGQRQGGLDGSDEYDVRCFFLCPDDRMAHTAVVDSRCEQMICGGLLKETATLHSSGQLPEGGQQARAIGYRQTLDYLKRDKFVENDGQSFSEYLNDFTTATRRYAKKQMQWFRRDDKFLFVPVVLGEDSSTRVDNVVNTIIELCTKPREEYDKEIEPMNDVKDKKIKLGNAETTRMTKSQRTRQLNEAQGKSMKFYQPKRHYIIEGSNEHKLILEEADECTSLLRPDVM